jgi:hypothetical protein
MSVIKKSDQGVSAGPWGGHGGSQWDDGTYQGVKQIVIVYAQAIDSIRFEYKGLLRSVWSERHGGNGGDKTERIQLNYPDEFVTCISGHFGPISHGPTIIRSLTIETNLRKFGPYGVEKGTYFSFPTNGGKIIGFHGKSGWYLDSIGVHLSYSDNTIWSAIKGGAKSLLSGK